MIDHVGFPVSDYVDVEAFYERALAPLGYVLVMEVAVNEMDAPAAGFGIGGNPDFWIGGEGGVGNPVHVAITAKDRGAVDAFHKAALPPAARTTARRACGRNTAPTTTPRSCSIPTGTISRRCATCRRDRRNIGRRCGVIAAWPTTATRGSGTSSRRSASAC